MRGFRVDLRFGSKSSHGRISDSMRTDDPAEAVEAYRTLLRRDDLSGQQVAARLVVDGRSLYYSEFAKAFGEGRIHPDAPLVLDCSREDAGRIAAWLPPQSP